MKKVDINNEVHFIYNVFTESIGMHALHYRNTLSQPNFTDFTGSTKDGSVVTFYKGYTGQVRSDEINNNKGKSGTGKWEIKCHCGNYFLKGTPVMKVDLYSDRKFQCSECDKREYINKKKDK
tara:strand:+ start:310 stop:675 length:366 start_codon:yes stop_codon:yes gene_type:complete